MEQDMTGMAALEPGTYKDFTGYINYNGIEGWAEHADFVLLDGYEKYMHGLVRMIWTDGVWKNGTFENGNWHDGIWEDGVFNLSSFHGGTWKNGTFLWSIWHNGTWLNGKFENSHWNGGRWKAGTWDPSSTVDDGQQKILQVTKHLTAEEWDLVRFKNGWCI